MANPDTSIGIDEGASASRLQGTLTDAAAFHVYLYESFNQISAQFTF